MVDNTYEKLVESCLVEGTALLKISAKKTQQRTFRVDVNQGRILWDSKKSRKGKYFILRMCDKKKFGNINSKRYLIFSYIS